MSPNRRVTRKPRHPDHRLTQRDMDLAASVQAVTEEVVVDFGGTKILAARISRGKIAEPRTVRSLQRMAA